MNLQCPSCEADDEFRVEVKSLATLSDDGVSDYDGAEYDEGSYCRCINCEFKGTVEDFTT